MTFAYPKNERGFTLLEIIIAMAISALIGVTAMKLLDDATLTERDIQERGERYNNIERAMLFLSNDIQQVAPRKFRDEFGDKKNNLVSDDSIGQTHLSFTKLGRRNPAGLARSNLEKLSYLVEEESLMRVSFIYPDGMNSEQGMKRLLLKNVKSLKLAFYDGEEWNDYWPVEGGALAKSDGTGNSLPVAIRITLELIDLGIVERLFIVSDRRADVS